MLKYVLQHFDFVNRIFTAIICKIFHSKQQANKISDVSGAKLIIN